MNSIPYKYSNLPIPGGGYVTGFAFHPKKKDLVYLRTDIGGTYRYNAADNSWKSLIGHVTMFDISESFVTAIALDKDHPERLYLTCGIGDRDGYRAGTFASSEDYGETFTYYKLPCHVHGNWPGRGTGMRLVVDPNNSDIIYFASQRGGLLRSNNRGKDWESISIETAGRKNEMNDTFIFVSPVSVKNNQSQILVLGTAGIDNATNNNTMRGHSLFISKDAGATWEKLSMPESKDIPNVKMSGLIGHRYDFDGKYLYVTLSATGKDSYVIDQGYSCDSGDACNGYIVRYPVDANGNLGDYENITPEGTVFNYTRNGFNECGFGGICSSPTVPGLLVASTLCEKRGDMVFMSKDYGDTWELKLYDLKVGNLHFNTSYMKPEYNGGHSLIHWLSDIKINPFNPDDVIFNTGTGVFGTDNFTSKDCSWCDRCTGIEETVHLNVYSPHKGPMKVIDIVGDLGGFAFEDMDTQCNDSFDDGKGNRYITCINADYSDIDPECVVVTPRGNWTGKTKGGLIISHDQCKTFDHLPMPFGLSAYTDELLEGISHPNVNAGWVAMSPDCKNIVWTLAHWIDLPIKAVLYSNDGGKTFGLSKVYDIDGNQVTKGSLKVFSDRVDSSIMYGFTSSKLIYISLDCGKTFRQYPVPAEVPEFPLGIIDTADKAAICPDHGRMGTFYMSIVEGGIWKIQYDKAADKLSFNKLTKDGDTVYKAGLGLISPDADYLTSDKAIYAAATIDGTYGFYLSTDECKSWTRINNDKQMFGEINCITGDARVFGRFVIATGSNGLIYGEPVK